MCRIAILQEEHVVQQHLSAILKFTICADLKYLRTRKLNLSPCHAHGEFDLIINDLQA